MIKAIKFYELLGSAIVEAGHEDTINIERGGGGGDHPPEQCL